jgi:hypothetical protein
MRLRVLGVQAPLGFCDPLGFSKDGDAATVGLLRSFGLQQRWRSLSPSIGLKFADVPNGLAAISKVPLSGWAQIIAYGAFVESKAGYDADCKAGGTPGNMGWKPPLLATDNPESKTRRLNSEIANGRLAMMAIIGMFFQDGLTGSAWGDWALYTDSPLRSGKKSPGFNTLPEWEVPMNGFSVAKFTRRREVELKHGRVSMLATIGYIVPEYFKFPGFCAPSEGLKFADIPNGLGALSKVPVAGWGQILAFAGFLEIVYNKPCAEPGNYGKGFLGLGSLGFSASIQDAGVRAKKLAAEVANGRLAMMAIIGMFFQDGLTGLAWGDWALFIASPLRAFESELGVQPPVGFWDPLGLSKGGEAATFKRRRAAELKHGRICMLATIGYIVPEYFKFPGYISPSLGLKFSDVPNGLAALSKVPIEGWLQIGLFQAHYEGFFFRQDPTRAPGDYADYGFLGIGKNFIFSFPPPQFDAQSRQKKLSAELANGRLAMMAIIGMFFQDGLTGSAWGDWSLYTASPLRAFENETGVQPPVGFWDPLGLSADGSIGNFKRRREVELKHGRLCMAVTIGYIVPEYYRFDGYLSPAYGIKFSDMPNGLSAISKVPALGVAQIVGFAMLIELNVYNNTVNDEPGNYGAGFLGLSSVGIISKIQDKSSVTQHRR